MDEIVIFIIIKSPVDITKKLDDMPSTSGKNTFWECNTSYNGEI